MLRTTPGQEKITTTSQQPWLLRSIWRDGQVKNTTSKSLLELSVFLLVVALFGTVLIVGLSAAFFSENSEMTFISGLFNILFQLAIIALVVFFFTQVKKAWNVWQRWKECILSLQTMPAFIGGTLQGTLTIPSGLENGSIIRCSLGCYRDRRRSNGRVMFNKGIPLWESDPLKTPVSTGLKSIPVLLTRHHVFHDGQRQFYVESTWSRDAPTEGELCEAVLSTLKV